MTLYMPAAENGLLDATSTRVSAPGIWLWSVDPGETPSSEWDLDPLARRPLEGAAPRAGQRGRAREAGHRVACELLGNLLGVAANELCFSRTCRFCGHPSHGKPTLVADRPMGLIDFSISYSPDLVLVAVAVDHHVGVDVQKVATLRSLPNWCFATEEMEILSRCPRSEFASQVTEVWTRKEAYAKASGLGLAQPLADVIAAGPCELWQLPRKGWRLDDVVLRDASLRAALAYDGRQEHIQLSHWRW